MQWPKSAIYLTFVFLDQRGIAMDHEIVPRRLPLP